jgi:hypothetical protein
MSTETETKPYRHRTLPIEASATAWGAAGFQVYSNSDVVSAGPRDMDEMLVIGLAATSEQNDLVIAWALTERQRRRELATAAEATHAEARAIAELATAIRSSTEKEFLDRLLSRLTERTQYAVKQQIGQ